MERRTFLKHTTMTTAGLILHQGILPASTDPERYKLTILHTNDVHSRLDPFPMNGTRLQGLGGVARRAALVRKIRSEEPNVLLLDAGDMLQGTPYFNMFDGEPEFTTMSAMGYDAGMLGNHDFDGGLDLLDRQWHHLRFPVLNANYDVRNTVLEGRVRDRIILEHGPIRIGLFGVGIELDGLVPEKLFGGVRYLDPVAVASQMARQLKREGCHLVVCLSHLGYRYDNERISDVKLARASEDIDIIIGGHTHTFLDQPDVVGNRLGSPVYIGQVGWAGVTLGRMDIWFEKNYRGRCITCTPELITNALD